MKKKLLLILSFPFFLHLYSQVPSDCTVSAALLGAYDEDVKDLALKRIQDLHAADTGSITISQIYQDSIWHGLAAIFNAFSVPARDSIFDVYCIHNWSTFTKTICTAINVGVNPSYSWTHPWANLVTTTGNISLDNLLSAYGFIVTYYFQPIDIATLRTSQSLNLNPLIDSIETFSGVNFAERNCGAGDANVITYNMIGNEQFFDFTLGWGDCPSGCTTSYTWKFKVNYSSCMVYYLGAFLSGGIDPWPLPTNCHITSNTGLNDTKTTDIGIYPNPLSSGKWQLSSTNDMIGKELKIYDAQGRNVSSLRITDATMQIDASFIARGVYLLKTGNSVLRLVKL
jgi:hypothetical protein